MKRGGLVLISAIAALVAGPAPCEGTKAVAQALAEATGVRAQPCSGAVLAALGAEQDATCGVCDGGLKAFKKRFKAEAAELLIAGSGATRVMDWTKAERPEVTRRAYWVGAATLEVAVNKKNSEVAFVWSRPYGRCGRDVPLPTPGFQIAPLFYPQRAAKEKLDGTVGLGMRIAEDGRPEVACIHHVSPGGYGFAFSAIESAHFYLAREMRVGGEDLGDVFSVLVLFSKASSRRSFGRSGFTD